MIYRLLFFAFLTLFACQDGSAKKFTLVIDAGHGGKDAGALGKYSKEKNINLNVALAFGRYVEQNCPDVKVIYTRKTDVFIPLHERADIANRNKADVFISIHTNAVKGSKTIAGLETYTMGMRRSDEKLSAAMRENEVIVMEDNYQQHYGGYDPRSPESLIMFEIIHDNNMAESVELAKLIQRHTCAAAGRPDKGVKQDVFLVLRETSMPACLVELGYITTPDEERYLNNRVNVEALGRGIYKAFVAYKKKRAGEIEVPFKPGVKPGQEQRQQQQEPSQQQQEPSQQQQGPSQQQQGPSQQQQGPSQRQQGPSQQQDQKEARQPGNQVTVPTDSTVDRPRTNPWLHQDEPVRTADQQPESASVTTPPAKPATKPVEPVTRQDTTSPETASAPVFKVQILASAAKLKQGSTQLKGRADATFYQEGGMYKYTVGESADYNEINRLRRSLAEKFPQAFVIAFRNGKKMDVQQAIQEFKANKTKK